MKNIKQVIALLIAASLIPFQAHAILRGVAGGGSGGATSTNRCTSLTTTQCAALYGYAVATEFGAKCDGTTDDTAALQSAMNTGYPVLVQGVCVTKTTLTATAANQGLFAFANNTIYDT